MNTIRTCQNCKNNFLIEPDEAAFHAKIGVPAPTRCPECRMQRRMLFYNDRSLYKKRSCGLCGKEVISAHRPDAPHPVYCQSCWWSDAWDLMKYGREYDFSRSFFEQFRDLWHAFPFPALSNIYASNVNSEYVNMCSYLKNCYLLFTSDFDEDCAYGSYLEQSKWCYDTDTSGMCEWFYDSIGLFKCYRVFYSYSIKESSDIYFSYDLKGCSNCFECAGLRNKQYHIFNEPHSKEEYLEKMKQYDLTSYAVVRELKAKLQEVKLTRPHRYVEGVLNTNVSGDYIFESKNVHQSYEIVGSEDWRHCQIFIIKGSKNCLDVTMWGSNLMEAYNCVAVGNNQSKMLGCFECWNEASNLTYCRYILSPNSDLFGCIGLRNKQYCILNTQYARGEYEQLVAKIKIQMTNDKEYGEFFPPEYSMYGYNETLANKYMPIPKEEALVKGYRWSEPEQRDYKIGGDIIGCTHAGTCNQQCSTAFR